MNKELYDFVHGIEEKETPNLDQVNERYFALIVKISKVLAILNGIILTFIFIFLLIISLSKRITAQQLIIYSTLSCCIIFLIDGALFRFIFRFDKIIYPYMVKKNPKAYMENQNLLPDYYYIMGWVKLKKEVRK